MSWSLLRHKKEKDGTPAAIYWARRTGERREFCVSGREPRISEAVEIRSPINAAGNGSEEPGELLSVEASARSGFFPLEAVEEFYVATTPEKLGLEVIG
jgi:hypothetical protein